MTTGSGDERVLLVLISVAQFMLVLDVSVMGMALPSISQQMGLSATSLSWVTNAYSLTFGGCLLLGGRLTDAWGPSRTFRASLVVFGVSALAGACSSSATALGTARAVQGLAAAALAPAILSVIVRRYPNGPLRDRALGLWGAAGAAGAPAGAILGGVLSQTFGWSSVLLLHVPLCLILVLAGRRVLPTDPSAARRSSDVVGATLVTTAAGTLIYGVVDTGRDGWASSQTAECVAVSAALAIALGWRERRHADPLIPIRLARSATIRIATAVAALVQAAMAAVCFVLTLYLQRDMSMSPLIAGVAFVPFGVFAIASSRMSPRLIGRWGARAVTALGTGCLSLALVLLLRVPDEARYLDDVLAPMMLLGTAGGFAVVGTSAIGLSDADADDAGVAGSLLTTAQQLGGVVGVAIAATLYDSTAPYRSSTTAALQTSVGLDAALAGIAVLVVLFAGGRWRRHRTPAHPESRS